MRTIEPLQDAVNPDTFDCHSSWKDVDCAGLAATWETLKAETPDIDVPDLPAGDLDDFQQLFVSLVLQHAEDVVDAWQNDQKPEPLRVMLLGTAGTGKTHAAKTMLHRLHAKGLLKDFTRVAAPTGTAAFNVGFNATTVHRLIQWFNPPFFQAVKIQNIWRRCSDTSKTHSYLSSTK